jgi:aminoglycoside 2''-phosphotransferase
MADLESLSARIHQAMPDLAIATLLVHYGERFVSLMEPGYHFSPDLIDRTRFRAAWLELEWAQIGLRHNDPSMLVAHIATARDYPPPSSTQLHLTSR